MSADRPTDVDYPSPEEMFIRCIHFFLLNLADALITAWAIYHLGDSVVEANPLMRVLIDWSIPTFIGIKIILGSLLAVGMYHIRTAWIRSYASVACIGFYWGIVLQNIGVVVTVTGAW